MTHNNEIWLKKGYEIFAISGLNGLKIEALSRIVGKSKSSFYHHFIDLEFFIELLLEFHLKQTILIAKKEQNVKNIDPELINILIEHKIDLLFNRQLRVNQHDKSFAKVLEKSNMNFGNSFVNIWEKELDSKLSKIQIENLYSLAIENFFLQLNEENINYKWLSNYFSNLYKIALQFK